MKNKLNQLSKDSEGMLTGGFATRSLPTLSIHGGGDTFCGSNGICFDNYICYTNSECSKMGRCPSNATSPGEIVKPITGFGDEINGLILTDF